MGIFPCKDKVGGKDSYYDQDHNQDQDEKEDDGEDVDDARAALGRWKAGERTGSGEFEVASKQLQQLRQLTAAA